jgi:lysyl-tRNA synthetase class 1
MSRGLMAREPNIQLVAPPVPASLILRFPFGRLIGMHWADVEAEALMKERSKHLISTGISPSGFIHVGSLREAITAQAVRKALVDKQADVKLIYLVDSFDPLRKLYPFLPPSYEAEVGKPLSAIPCPCGNHESYAQHFMQPFLDAIQLLGIYPEIHWTHKHYEEGLFAQAADIIIQKKEQVATILREVTGRDVPEGFFPYTPVCPACGKFSNGHILGYEYPFVRFDCHCGNEGKADVRKADGKLPWRLEWAAKWYALGVTCEPFGKDHAAAGGSYDTGVRFAREIFGIEPPHPIPYEFVQMKGKGQMHKSTGTAVTGIDALHITPPPVLNFSFLRYNPDRHIDYDSGLGVLDVVDEYDRIEGLYYKGGADEKEVDLLRAYALAQPKGQRPHLPLQIPYRHLVSVVQIADTFDRVLEILKRTEQIAELEKEDEEMLRQRVDSVRFWLDGWAPDEVKFSVCATLPSVKLSDQELNFLRCIHTELQTLDWQGDRIHDKVYEGAKACAIGAKTGFQCLYRIFIDRSQGPRLGFFLSTLDKQFVLQRIQEAIAASPRDAP